MQSHSNKSHSTQFCWNPFLYIFSPIILLITVAASFPIPRVAAHFINGTQVLFDVTNPNDVFSSPFGYLGTDKWFTPRITFDQWGNIIENTDYAVKNPDLGNRIICFGVPFNTIWHAGEDLYFYNVDYSTANLPVYSIADGIVVYSPQETSWPGATIIMEHNTSEGKYYSIYMHLDPGTISVSENQFYERKTFLGKVLHQDYTGAYPEYHIGIDDSHLHFEIRNFYDASAIYPQTTSCNGAIPGRGYTYPTHPNYYPSYTSHYIHPSEFIEEHAIKLYLPNILR